MIRHLNHKHTHIFILPVGCMQPVFRSRNSCALCSCATSLSSSALCMAFSCIVTRTTAVGNHALHKAGIELLYECISWLLHVTEAEQTPLPQLNCQTIADSTRRCGVCFACGLLSNNEDDLSSSIIIIIIKAAYMHNLAAQDLYCKTFLADPARSVNATCVLC